MRLDQGATLHLVIVIHLVGKDGSHLRLSIQTEKKPMIGIAFSQAKFLTHIRLKKPFSIVYTLDQNEWNGQTSLQLKVKDLMI